MSNGTLDARTTCLENYGYLLLTALFLLPGRIVSPT